MFSISSFVLLMHALCMVLSTACWSHSSPHWASLFSVEICPSTLSAFGITWAFLFFYGPVYQHVGSCCVLKLRVQYSCLKFLVQTTSGLSRGVVFVAQNGALILQGTFLIPQLDSVCRPCSWTSTSQNIKDLLHLKLIICGQPVPSPSMFYTGGIQSAAQLEKTEPFNDILSCHPWHDQLNCSSKYFDLLCISLFINTLF